MKRISHGWALVFSVLILSPVVFGGQAEVLRKGVELEAAKKYDEAITLYREALKTDPSEEIFKKAASLLGKLKRFDEAGEVLKAGLAKFPESVGLRNLQGLVNFSTGRKDTARSDWKWVLDKEPQNKFAQEWMAKLPSQGGTPATAPGATTSSAGSGSVAGDEDDQTPLKPEEQEKLAKKIFDELGGTDQWKLEEFEKKYQTVIKRCPDTQQAQEACWRLSNLYLTGYEAANGSPNYQGIIDTLEHLIAKYPKTVIREDAEKRLLFAYEKGGKFDKAAEIYSRRILDPELDDESYMTVAIGYADSLSQIGKGEEARKLYETVIQRDNNRNGFQAEIARMRLQGTPTGQ